ncbi:MAG: D-alanyl-D-alanine carboxypeptidase/D-alanyl-D-alanine-endopeptidase [Bryobacteraceae bacterium]
MIAVTGIHAASLEHRIARILETSPAAARSFYGIEVVDLTNGRSIYSKNATHFLIPASNTKLFTTALALTRLGPEYRYETKVVSAVSPDSTGRLRGDLVLKGSGDPSLTGQPIPYDKDAPRGDAMRAIEDLADQIAASGIRRIDGDVVGDDTAYVWEPYPPGWAEADAVWDYGAPVSALTLNDNMFRLTINPGDRPGAAAQLSFDPPLEYFWVDNRVRTGDVTKIVADRFAGSPQLLLSGTVRAPETETLAVDDPARFAAWALADALMRRGIAIHGQPVARHRFSSGDAAPPAEPVTLASRTSPALVELLRVTAKISQNLYAELFLREAGHGSRKAGLEELKTFLAGAGVEPDDYHFVDGSGLSRLTLVTPRAVTQLLAWMYGSVNRDTWIALMPIGGEDGTLEHRFNGATAAHMIHAKTGSLSHTSALSGYALRKSRHPLAFSIVVNDFNSSSDAVHQFMDKIALALLE